MASTIKGRMLDGARALTLVCLIAGPAKAAAQDAARLTATIAAVSAGEDAAARRAAIVNRLHDSGVPSELQPFGTGERSGVNVLVTLPGRDPRVVLVGAHYDRVAVGRGAVDNGAACAALLELIDAFKASPLGRYTLQFVFFDREEGELLGSRAYFAANDPRPVYAMNLDIFAYGNEFFVTASNRDGALLRQWQAAADAAGIRVRDTAVDRYPGSDHRSMMGAGIETLGIALVDTADIDAVLEIGGSRLATGKGPRIMSIIHTANDTTAEVRVADIMRALPVLERTIRSLDRAQ